MDEIWLAMNIVYEIALSVAPWLAVLLLVWLALLVLARKRLSLCALRPALVLTALVAGVLFFALPALTQSSFANMGYWVDWANLLAVALGLGALVGVSCSPVAALLCPRCAIKVR